MSGYEWRLRTSRQAVAAALVVASLCSGQLSKAQMQNGSPVQHGDHSMPMPSADAHQGHPESGGHEDTMAMSTHSMSLMADPLGIPRSRMGSGTSWLPDASPMYGVMSSLGAGGVMLHANVFAGYDWFGSERGSQRFVSMNSFMGMLWQPVGTGELMGRLMVSAEPVTLGERGYPLILQTGETANGAPLHDRQHPHDLFMEIAVSYAVPLASGVGLQLYVAPAGEPALGPTAYPHRISAISDPLAPLGHHWQDSTHILFGVMTAGIFTHHIKLEGSWFNGREPDENRWDLDLRRPDSFSGRLTWNPTDAWSLQGSYGYLASPEPSEPGVSVQRVTASATFNKRLGDEPNWATTFVFGQNMPSEGAITPSALLESNWNIDGHHVVYGRVEYVRKIGHDLVLPPELDEESFDVGMLGLGYVYYFGPFASLAPGIGVRGSVAVIGDAIEPYYSQTFPLGAILFVQIRPSAMSM